MINHFIAQAHELTTGLSGINWNTIILGMLSLLGSAITGVLAYLTVKLNKKADKAAEEVEKVKEELVGSTVDQKNQLKEISKTGKVTLGYVDGAMAAQLLLVRNLTRWKAEQEPTEANQADAKTADEAYFTHMKQKKLHDREQAAAVAPPSQPSAPGSIKEQLTELKEVGEDTQDRVKNIEKVVQPENKPTYP